MQMTAISTYLGQLRGTSAEKVIVAVDVGFGYTKWAYKSSRAGGDVASGIFPSLAPLRVNERSNAGMLEKRDTRVVEVNGKLFEVGPDSSLVQAISGARRITDNYIESEEYLALLRGAIDYCKESTIHTLVLGLPVTHSRHKDKIEKLKKLASGKHIYPGGYEKTVHDVVVVDQPLGCFIDYMCSFNRIKEYSNKRTLCLDPGQYTFDWLTCIGMKKIENECDSHVYSMQRALDTISKAISDELGFHFNNDHYLEQAMERGVIKLDKNEYPIDRFVTDEVVSYRNDAIGMMYKRLKNVELIENVIVGGGAARFFLPAIKSAFSNQNIIVSDKGVMANVCGFLYAGILRELSVIK
jgi:plasmid segregation protein ParM